MPLGVDVGEIVPVLVRVLVPVRVEERETDIVEDEVDVGIGV